MAVSDMVYDQAAVLDDQYMDMVPSVAGHEWVIHNISIPFGSACEIYHSDGSNDILDLITSTALLSYNFHCNLYSYYRIKNVSGTTIYVSYDGVVMNE